VRWNIVLADEKLGYFSTMAPLIVRDHVIVGISGDVTDIPGWLESIDPDTGKVQWRFYTQPKKGEPGAETWPKEGDAITHGGGMTWMTGTYDPGTNLVYWGTGNPNPVLVGEGRPANSRGITSPRLMTSTIGTPSRRPCYLTRNSKASSANCLPRPAATVTSSSWIGPMANTC
jgi:glucose dehydrogenase